MKSKRLLGLLVVLAFTVVSVVGCFNAAAASTYVEVPDYLPEIGTILLDDDFQGSSVSDKNYINTDYTYGCLNGYMATVNSSNALQIVSLITEGTNKFLKFGKSVYVKTRSKGSVAGDKFVIYFEVMPNMSTSGLKGFNICFGNNKKALRVIFSDSTGNATTCKFFVTDEANANNPLTSGTNIVSKTSFAKVALVLEKVNVDGEDKAILSEVYLNDAKLKLASKAPNTYLANNWFSASSSGNTVYIGNFSEKNIFSMDNVLAYVAATPTTCLKNINLTSKTLDVQNVDGTALTGKLIVAGYDASGNLVGVKSDVAVNAAASTTSSVSFTLPEGSASSYKFFVWDGLDNCTPCLEQVQVSAE